MKRYNEGFETEADIEREFEIETGFIKNNNFEVLYSTYQTGAYDGDAFLILRNKETKELFEVNASHCSCFGLEGQFCLEPTSLESLKMRKDYTETDYLGIVEFIEGLDGK